jgi:UDP-N-acetylglucosamine--N-acetylmuramyl-(pentapeptide) pyrophosphoryl-undecaprenol N-acetylglucosamine transferase
MRVLITGGHFSPAYAVISELKSRGHEVMVAGRRYPFEGDLSESMEYALCKMENLRFYEVKTGRFQRKFTSYTVTSLLKTPSGFFSALSILRQSKPDIVMTFGGYIGLPISLAARVLGIPVILHEQTQKAGLASTIIGKFATKICISFDDSRKNFPEARTVLTGNPIRHEVFETSGGGGTIKNISDKSEVLYITGGSTGSHFINALVEKTIIRLLEKYIVIHQTGDSKRFTDFENLNEIRKSLPEEKQEKYFLKKFIFPKEIGTIMRRADLVIGRSGANTIFEIMATGKISLLIPLPHGQVSEQLSNAKLIKTLGIGEYLEQKDAIPDRFITMIAQILKEKDLYIKNFEKAQKFIIKDAEEKIVNILEKYAKTGS